MSKASDLARLMTSGSTSLHGEAGVTASGSTGLTTNLQQGLAKFWISHDAKTDSTLDSFNFDSVTDNGTGDHTFSFTNNMSNNDYALATHGQEDSGGGGRCVCGKGTPATSSRQINSTIASSGANDDFSFTDIHVNGDLA